MHFGIDLPISGQFGDPRLLADLARDAEAAGWDGCFLWDHIQLGRAEPIADPWISLAAIALATTRIRIGTLVTPLYRRSPWKLARETVTLDRLSQGRQVLGVGSGSDIFGEISTFGGPLDDLTRAHMLDEGLAVLIGLWTGELFSFTGRHYNVNEAQFQPLPLQSPRIPIWVAATWPKKAPLRRAARYEGVVPVAGDFAHSITPAQLSELIKYIKQLRTDNSLFEVVQLGNTARATSKHEVVAAYAAAGATWWVETFGLGHEPIEKARDRIREGPPC